MKWSLAIAGAAGVIALQAEELSGITEADLVVVSVVDRAETEWAAWSLADEWDVRKIVTEQVRYSSEGWDAESKPVGDSVRLTLVPTVNGVENADRAIVIAEGLTGRSTYAWTPENVVRMKYNLKHEVLKDGVVVASETLLGRYTFERCEFETVSEDDLRAAVSGVTQFFNVTNDADNAWTLVDVHGEGLFAPEIGEGESSTLTFFLRGAGTFSVAATLGLDAEAVGQLQFVVDGEAVETMSEAGTDELFSFDFTTEGVHTVAVVFTRTSGAVSASVRDARWGLAPVSAEGVHVCATVSDPFRTDFREGVRVITLPEEVMPFVYSCTNFTGVAGATAASVAKVEVVKLQGEDEDITAWQPVGKVKTLVAASDEGSVVWNVKTGVWKATFTILSAEQAVWTETAYFDCRAVKAPGLKIIIR